MARIIKMPPPDELPDGPRRVFVEELRRYYRAAGRPPLREVEGRIKGRTDLKEITASQETVRRILRGMVIPTDWNRVNAIFQVFCEIGDIDPEGDRWEEDSRYSGGETNRERLRQLWDQALEEDPNPSSIPRPTPPPPEPAQTASRYRADDPWASESGNSGLSAEPPF
jgi:hypothetical protein